MINRPLVDGDIDRLCSLRNFSGKSWQHLVRAMTYLAANHWDIKSKLWDVPCHVLDKCYIRDLTVCTTVYVTWYSAWQAIIFFIMMTLSNGKIFRVTGHLCGNSPVTSEFPAQRPMTQTFDVFFDLHLNNGWVNNRKADKIRCHRTHYDAIVMMPLVFLKNFSHVTFLTASHLVDILMDL